MKVLLVSEGKHELGHDYRDKDFAPLAALVRRAIDKKVEFTTMTVRDFGHVHGKGGALFKKGILCLKYAANHGFDALVFVIDQDDDPGRRKHLDDAQEHLGFSVRRAFGLAIRTFDAWMLADERALSKALGRTIQRQPNPEEIGDAKAHCQRLRDDNEIGLTDLYTTLADDADLAVIAERCPKGFGAFALRLKNI